MRFPLTSSMHYSHLNATLALNMRKRQQPTGLQTALIDKTRDVLLHCLTHGIRVECAFDDRYVLEILPNAFEDWVSRI